MMDTEGDSKMTVLTLELAKSAIAAAVKTVKEDKYTTKNINWITHSEFTAERGRRQIEEFVLTWEFQDLWEHHTKLIEMKDVAHSFYYIYSVCWNIQTANTPMALGSASAYFTIKVNKNKTPDAPIDVSYIFEGHSLVHRPGMTYFREKWLWDLIEAKHMLMESIPF